MNKVVSLVLKAVTVFSAVIGTILSAYAGNNSFMGGGKAFMFFTIQSNIAIAIICAIGCFLLLKGKPAGRAWYVVKYVGTVAITLTGVVFVVVLAPTLGVHAWRIHNVLTHVVVTAAAIADFFVTAPDVSIKKSNTFFVLLPPILYAIYAGIGYVRGWEFIDGINYPYFFLNWGSPTGAFGFTNELPFMGCAWCIALLLVFLLIVGYFYLAMADRIAKRRKTD